MPADYAPRRAVCHWRRPTYAPRSSPHVSHFTSVATPGAAPVDPATVHNCGAEKPSLDAEAKGYRRKVPQNENADDSARSVPSLPGHRPGGGHIAVPTPADTRRLLQHANRQRTAGLTRREMGRV